MSAQLDALKMKVQNILSQNLRLGLSKDGALTVLVDSSQTWVRCWEPADGQRRFVSIECPLIFDVQPTPEVFRYIALHADDKIYGHLSCSEGEDGLIIMFTHQLLGDYLDEEELLQAVYGVAGSGEDLDDELQGMFGGKRYADL